MKKKIISGAFTLVFFIVTVSTAHIFERPSSVFKRYLNDADETKRISVKVDTECIKWIESKERRKIRLKSRYSFTAGYKDGGAYRYIIIDNETGKHQPITFATVISSGGEIEDVIILAYREAYGGEIVSPRFLKQFHKKKYSDPLSPGNDIINITGATISTRSISRGVKRDMLLWKWKFGDKKMRQKFYLRSDDALFHE